MEIVCCIEDFKIFYSQINLIVIRLLPVVDICVANFYRKNRVRVVIGMYEISLDRCQLYFDLDEEPWLIQAAFVLSCLNLVKLATFFLNDGSWSRGACRLQILIRLIDLFFQVLVKSLTLFCKLGFFDRLVRIDKLK